MTGAVITGSLNMNAYAKTINGDKGDNTLKGTSGDDRLNGKDGDDVFYGYSGSDYFNCGKGKDTIRDFNPSEGDGKSSGCEKVDYAGKSNNGDHDNADDKNDKNGGNSADQGIGQGQSSKQNSQCVSGGDTGNSCNNISVQAQANTGNNALGQKGGSGDGNGKGGNSADQGIGQGQSSDQESQCVSGEDATVSCNNLSFQNQINSGNNALGQLR